MLMALHIVDRCVNCYACQMVCPTGSIGKTAQQSHFTIQPETCHECADQYPEPQCASICPIEAAIVNADGSPVNPMGSLTGLPPDKAVLV
jgi:ferredoxin